MERYKCDSSLQQFDFWPLRCFELSTDRGPRFHFPRGMFSEVDVRFASSFHTLCSRHIDPPELLHLADSSPMHRRNVALVAVMNTPTTFCNVNYVQKKWVLNIMTDELSMNENKFCCNLSYSPLRGCSLWWEQRNQDGVTKLSKLSLALTFRQQFREFRPEFGPVVL